MSADILVNKSLICQNCAYRLNKPCGELKPGWCTAKQIYVRRKDSRAARCGVFAQKHILPPRRDDGAKDPP